MNDDDGDDQVRVDLYVNIYKILGGCGWRGGAGVIGEVHY